MGVAIALGSSGIVLGSTDSFGVHWSVQAGSDLFGNPPAPREVTGERATDHGNWNATEVYGPRPWTVGLLVKAASHDELHRARHRLAAAAGLAPFKVVCTEAFYGDRTAHYRRQGELLWTEDAPTLARASLALIADDPRIRAVNTSSAVALPPSSVGGLAVPFSAPFTIDAAVTAGGLALVNDGNETAAVTWRIDGPVSSPTITDLTNGRQLRTSLNLGSGDWVVINGATGQVYANGDPNASRRDRVFGDWINARPGLTQIAFNGTAPGPGAQLSASWRSTWI